MFCGRQFSCGLDAEDAGLVDRLLGMTAARGDESRSQRMIEGLMVWLPWYLKQLIPLFSWKNFRFLTPLYCGFLAPGSCSSDFCAGSSLLSVRITQGLVIGLSLCSHLLAFSPSSIDQILRVLNKIQSLCRGLKDSAR